MSTTPQIAAQTLSEMGGRATALKLCQKLCQDGHTQRDSQLAIQRAFDKGLIVVERDLTLRVGNLSERAVTVDDIKVECIESETRPAMKNPVPLSD